MILTILGAFKTNKFGNSSDEYEDSFAISSDRFKIAISDGATEASFSKEWAEILVNYFINNPPEKVTNEWLEAVYAKFISSINISKLPWYAQNKVIEQGSYATLSGIKIDNEGGNFIGLAVGDSCIFWVDSEGYHLFPFRNVEEFNSRPFLISTMKQNNDEIDNEKNQKIINNKLSSGKTVFYLMTDALACWFVGECCKGNIPWNELDNIKDEENFLSFISELRNSKALKNDDVTLVMLEVIGDSGVDNSVLSINERI